MKPVKNSIAPLYVGKRVIAIRPGVDHITSRGRRDEAPSYRLVETLKAAGEWYDYKVGDKGTMITKGEYFYEIKADDGKWYSKAATFSWAIIPED